MVTKVKNWERVKNKQSCLPRYDLRRRGQIIAKKHAKEGKQGFERSLGFQMQQFAGGCDEGVIT